METVQAYYRLSKPGIVYGNTLALLVGFFFYSLAASVVPSLWQLIGAAAGAALVMASACVANNIFDRDIDIRMARTQSRALVTGAIDVVPASMYSVITLIMGSLVLFITNPITMYLGVAGWISYALVYTYAKRVTYHATLIGTFPGAIPPVIGYYGAGGESSSIAVILFTVLVTWQMVHFYAIAIYRKQQYADADIPIVTRIKGTRATITYMQTWTYISACALLVTTYYGSVLYALLTIILVVWWFRATLYQEQEPIKWARGVFFSSLWFLVAWLAATVISVAVGHL